MRVRATALVMCCAGCGSFGACAPGASAPASAADLLVTVRNGAVAAPDSVAPGWARFRVDEDGEGHIVVLFRVVDGSAATLDAVASAIDTAATTPASVVALGGPEIGDTGEIHVELTPGRYVLGCVLRGDDGHRHVAAGEAKLLVVTTAPIPPERVSSPTATLDVPMADFAYTGSERWPAGPQVLRVENRGDQDHQLRIGRLRAGATLATWRTASQRRDVETPIAGVARLGPGGIAFLTVDLPRGEYVIYCLVADRASGRPHVELGMFRGVHVE